MGGGLAFERGVHRQHDLVDPARGDARDQLVDAEILGPHAFQRRQPAAEHMVAAGEQPRAVERPQVGDFLDHAQQAVVAARVAADAARVGGVDIAAGRAGRQRLATPPGARRAAAPAPPRASSSGAAPRAAPSAGRGPGSRASAWVSASISWLMPWLRHRGAWRRAQARAIGGRHADHLHGQPGLRRADARRAGRGGA